MPSSNRILRITVPLSPLIHPGESQPRPTLRLRPIDSLNLQHLTAELQPSTLATFEIDGRPWSVIAVVSPYSSDPHVMVMEVSTDRYLPGPEHIEAREGEGVMSLLGAILKSLGPSEHCNRLCMGYNWSPRAWGNYEERGGFQSIPTKWHMMLWTWPEFPPEGQSDASMDWIPTGELSAAALRVLIENDYARPLSTLLLEKIKAIPNLAHLQLDLATADARGLRIPLSASSLGDVLPAGGFHQRCLAPMAAALEGVYRDLSESFTSMRFADIDRVLEGVARGPLSERDLQALRAPPFMRANELTLEVPPDLERILLNAMEARCNQSGDPADWWRKGFGYSLVVVEDRALRETFLRILPGVYVGPGGVVEAQRVVLRRSETQMQAVETLKEKSSRLWQLAEDVAGRSPF